MHGVLSRLSAWHANYDKVLLHPASRCRSTNNMSQPWRCWRLATRKATPLVDRFDLPAAESLQVA